MATTIETRSRTLTPESRFVLHDVGWEGYDTLLNLIGDRAIRLTYDQGSVELMAPSQDHEQYRRLLGKMIDILVDELHLPCILAGSTTWRIKDRDRGLEPDDCFYLANAERVRGKKIDLSVDPPPDLAVEIEISRSALDRLGTYAALRVPEVWRFDGETLVVELLQDDRTYAPSTTSLNFPFLPLDEFVRFLKQAESMDHSELGREFRRWVRDELIPRLAGGRANDDIQGEHP
jgi:Uma2 family endonuclease